MREHMHGTDAGAAAAPDAAIRIRAMQGADADAVAVLDAACFSQGWPAADHAAYAEDLNVIALVVCGDVHADDGAPTDAGTGIVPEGILGYILVQCAADEGDVLRVAVRPDQRRRGIGAALVRAAFAAARDHAVRQIFLEVRAGNAAAVALYAGSGFEQVGVRRNYYRDPIEDALLMRWTDDRT